MPDFDSLINHLKSQALEEIPVSIAEFVQSKDFLGLPPLSEYQYRLIRAGTQIYDESTLIEMYGEDEGSKIYGQTFNEVVMVLGKGCHAPYTKVFNAKTGRWQRLDSMSSGDNVIQALAGPEYATESFREGRGEMVRVTTQLGLSEDVFIGHQYHGYKKSKFYKRDERNIAPERIRAENLSLGDRIGVRVGFEPENPVSIGSDVAFVLGLWIGDGCLPQTYESSKSAGASIDFGSIETESLSRYLDIVNAWGDSPRVVRHETKNMVTVFHTRRTSPRLFRMFDDFDLNEKSARTKTIPDGLWNAPNAELAEFASGMFSSDGSAYTKGERFLAEWCSISPELADGFQKILLRIGVPATLRSKTPSYTYLGEKRDGQRAYVLTVGGADRLATLANAVTLYDHKGRTIRDFVSSRKFGRDYDRIIGGVYFDRVVAIDPIGEGDYWTLTVPDSGMYVGNGMLSYNSGKDFCSTVICSYIVYLLLCLRDPQEYFGKPPGDMIDIMNIAINSAQAYNVFFRGVKTRIERCPWFEGKYQMHEATRMIEFDKSIRLISGHSESENLEGYNVLLVVLDEISGFGGEGTDRRVTAESTYKMHRASVVSRFGQRGKLLLLSFPRHKNDFIMKRYNEVIGAKFSVRKSHTFKLNPNLPDGMEDNEFVIEWEEDEIEGYKIPGVYALKRPSWVVNPTKSIDDYTMEFFTDPQDALTRFACMPAEAMYGFFRDQEKVDKALVGINGVDEHGRFREDFRPDDSKQYFIHVDLSLKHDKCAVTMSHVENWEKYHIGVVQSDTLPFVVVDAIMWWTPTSERTVDFVEVREYIMSLRHRGFNIKYISFDRWRSEALIEYFNNAGVEAGLLSVSRQHYDDLQMMVQAGRIQAPALDDLRDELLALRIMPNGKVDHPRSGFKDISDSLTGSVYNAITRTERPTDDSEINIVTPADLRPPRAAVMNTGINPPRRMPAEVGDYLEEMRIL